MIVIEFEDMWMDGCSVQCWNLMFMQEEVFFHVLLPQNGDNRGTGD